MPEVVKDTTVDPVVATQWDDKTPQAEVRKDLYKITDKLQVCLLGTDRPGIGPVHRSMAVAKRVGPDFLFLANANSAKFNDIKHSKTCTVTFQNSSSQDWVSVTGEIVTATHDDPRAKEVYSKGTNAWLGDVGDGVHDGGPEDPRMCLIEVKATYISYWMSTVTSVGFVKEVAQASMQGKVANNGARKDA